MMNSLTTSRTGACSNPAPDGERPYATSASLEASGLPECPAGASADMPGIQPLPVGAAGGSASVAAGTSSQPERLRWRADAPRAPRRHRSDGQNRRAVKWLPSLGEAQFAEVRGPDHSRQHRPWVVVSADGTRQVLESQEDAASVGIGGRFFSFRAHVAHLPLCFVTCRTIPIALPPLALGFFLDASLAHPI